jgi:hypothetical protein
MKSYALVAAVSVLAQGAIMVNRVPAVLFGGLLAVSACASEDRSKELTAPAASTQINGKGAAAGFVTSQAAQARVLLPQATLRPILSTGDILPGSGEPWAPTPDGLGAYEAQGKLVVFANHELNASGVTSSNGGPPFMFARVSKLTLDPATLSVVDGRYVDGGSSKLIRLCSATWADGEVGFPTGYFLTGEEQTGTANGSTVVAYDQSGAKTFLPHFGAFSHENQVPVPGFPGKVVVIGLDDTSGASELYMYVANTEQDAISGNGKLYVLKTDLKTPARTKLHSGNLQEGVPIDASFVEVPNPADLGTAPASRSANLQTKVDALGAMPFVRIGAASGWASPDNVATTHKSIMVMEDPAYSGFDGSRAPALWNFRIIGDGRKLGEPRKVVEVTQETLIPGLTGKCVEPSNQCWESSGIISTERWLGEGTWLFDVQAHTLPFSVTRNGSTFNYVNEGGQLLYLRLPGT